MALKAPACGGRNSVGVRAGIVKGCQSFLQSKQNPLDYWYFPFCLPVGRPLVLHPGPRPQKSSGKLDDRWITHTARHNPTLTAEHPAGTQNSGGMGNVETWRQRSGFSLQCKTTASPTFLTCPLLPHPGPSEGSHTESCTSSFPRPRRSCRSCQETLSLS